MRPCEVFIQKRGAFLGDFGYEVDPGRVERRGGHIVFYHYTRSERLDQIFAPGSGLRARLRVLATELTPDFVGFFHIEGLLEPYPRWFKDGPYFGDLPLEMVKKVVGNKLLRIEVPHDFPNMYVVDPFVIG
jgi:hypothetical protein